MAYYVTPEAPLSEKKDLGLQKGPFFNNILCCVLDLIQAQLTEKWKMFKGLMLIRLEFRCNILYPPWKKKNQKMFPNNLCKVSQVSSMSQTVMLESNFVNFNKWPSQVLYRPSPPPLRPRPTLALKSFSSAKKQ